MPFIVWLAFDKVADVDVLVTSVAAHATVNMLANSIPQQNTRDLSGWERQQRLSPSEPVLTAAGDTSSWYDRL